MATLYWKGSAAAVQQIDTITVGGTWAGSETLTLTINSNDLVITLANASSTSAIAEMIFRAVKATNRLYNKVDDEEVNVGGQEIPEFTEVDAEWETGDSTVDIIGKVRGVPHTMTVSETSASGTIGIASTQACTGPNFWDNGDNWSTGSTPATDDDVYFDRGAVDVLHGLPNGSLQLTSFNVTMGYGGHIGLPKWNPIGYLEYRARYASFDDDSTIVTAPIFIVGEGNGPGPRRVNFKQTADSALVTVQNTGQAEPGELAVVNFTNDASDTANELHVKRGSVAVANETGDTSRIDDLTVSYLNNQANDALVILGDGMTASHIPLDQSGGVVRATCLLLSATLRAGLLYIDTAGAISTGVTTLTIYGGRYEQTSGGNIDTLTIGGPGVADFSRAKTGISISNLELHRGATLLDPNSLITYSAGIDVHSARLSDVTIDIGPNRRITPGTIS